MASPAPPSASGDCSARTSSTAGSTRGSAPATWSCRWPTTPTSRSSRCSTTPRPTRRRSARPCAPAPPSAAAGSAGSSPSTTSPPSSTGSGREAANGNRHRPDGTELPWKQIGVNGLIADPQLPFFVQWSSPRRAAPRHGAGRDFSLACLEIAGDPQRVSEWLGETVEAPLEDVKVEWVAPQRHARHHRRAVPDPARTGPRSDGPSVPGDPARAPNIWQHPATYEIENRAVDPRRSPRRRDVGDRVAGRGRAVLDIGCGTGFHLPRFAATAASRGRRRAAPRPGRRSPGGVPGGSPNVTVLPGYWRRRCRCPTRRSTSCMPGGRTSSARDASPGWPSWTGSYAAAARRSSIDNDATRSTFGGVVPARLPRGRPGGRRAVLVDRTAGPGRRSTSAGVRRRAPTWRRSSGSSSPPRSPRRSWPSTRAPTSTTRSTSGRTDGYSARTAADDERRRRAARPGRRPRAAWPSRPSSALTISTATCSSGCRTEVSPGGTTWATWESSKPTTATSRPAVEAAVAQRVQHPHRQGVGGADERRRRWPRRAARPRPRARLATVSSTREASPVVGRPRACMRAGPARPPVLADEGVLAPADPGDPRVARVEQVVGGQLGAGGAVDVDPRVGGLGVVPRPAERDERRPPLAQPGRLRVAEVGVGHDEGVDGGRAEQVVVPGDGSSASPGNSSTW